MSVKPTLGRKFPIRRWSAAAVYNTQSAHFDGVDDEVTSTGTGLGGVGGTYSLHCFANWDVRGQNKTLISERNTTSIPFRFFTENVASNQRIALYGLTALDAEITAFGTTIPTTGTWYELLGVRNAGTWTLYVNRVQEGQVTEQNGDCSSANTTLYLGSLVASQFFDGLLKDIRLFNVALNATNIALLTVANIGRKPSEISGWDTANAADANQLRHYNFESPWSNATVNDASQVKDTGNDASHGTGAGFAGSATSGVDTIVPS